MYVAYYKLFVEMGIHVKCEACTTTIGSHYMSDVSKGSERHVSS